LKTFELGLAVVFKRKQESGRCLAHLEQHLVDILQVRFKKEKGKRVGYRAEYYTHRPVEHVRRTFFDHLTPIEPACLVCRGFGI